MKKILPGFWRWYEKHKTLNTGIASVLFTLQLVHLYWITTDVVAVKLLEKSLYNHSIRAGLFSFLILIVDYLEIPAILSASILYLNELRKKFNKKGLWYLIFVNSQWLHILWITDEFVLEHILSHTGSTFFPVWLAWIAIGIDYLELPVIFDTLKKFSATLRGERLWTAFKRFKANKGKENRE